MTIIVYLLMGVVAIVTVGWLARELLDETIAALILTGGRSGGAAPIVAMIGAVAVGLIAAIVFWL